MRSRKLLPLLTVAALLACMLLSLAPVGAQDYPNVANLRPFSPEANYMSLPGYLRYLVYERDGIWLSRAEVVAIVDAQIAAAGR
jgi:hypothetical protein